MGICGANCALTAQDIYAKKLRKVHLTILDEETCKKAATVEEDQFYQKQVFNQRKELCSGFLRTVNLSLVSYKKEEEKAG